MKSNHFRVRLTWLLLAALILPILAACGGSTTPGGGGTDASTAPAASTGGATTSAAASTDASTPAASTDASAPAASTDASASAASTDASPAASTAGAAGGSEDTAKFLVYANPGEPDSLDSMDTTSGQALTVAEQIEEPLVGRATGKISPLLAEKWTPNGDSTEWAFNLRKGVKFHDGTDFNADAVVFNFQRMGDPKNEFAYRDQGKTYAAFGDLFGGDIGTESTAFKSIEKVDESTVKFTMTRPVPLLPEVLSATYFGISSPDAVKKAGAKYGTPDGGAVGTGPFKYESWTAKQNIILTRNDEYWGEKAKMPGAVVRFIADAPARLAELQAGSVDFTTGLPADSRETVKGDNNLQEVPVEPFNTAYLAMNFNSKPFDNPKVRQAIAHAINKQEILDAFYGGVGQVATDFLPDSFKEVRPDKVDTYDYDPEKAKALLAEAGFPDGFDTMTLTDGTQTALEFWYMPVSRPYFPTPKPIAEAIATQLADVGIKVELKTEDWGAYLDNVDAGKKNGMWMLGWTGDYDDPNNFLYVFFGPSAKTQQGYENKQLIETLQNAGSAKNKGESIKLFKQAGTVISQELPRIPIVHAPPVYAAKKTLSGWKPTRYGHEPWTTISVEK